MKQKWLIVILVLALLISGYFIFVSASQPTQQYNKIYLSPFYSASSVQNVNYTYTISINPPDGISSVKSAILTFDAYINPTRTFYAWVNGLPCNNPTYVVSTTYSSAGKSQFYFDCSNVINQSGNYNVSLMIVGGNIGASTGWLDLTYMNNPVGTADVYGTEYQPLENGTIFLQLFDNQRNIVNNGSCKVTIYYPDKTKWYDNINMEFLENGLYYKNFFTPSILGIYITNVFCYYNNDGSELELPSQNCGYDGSIESATSPAPVSVQHSDCVHFASKGTYQEFVFNNSYTQNVNISTLTSISLNWIGKTERDNSVLQTYNWNTASWVTWGSSFLKSSSKNDDCDGQMGIGREVNSSFGSYVNSSYGIKFRIYNPSSGVIRTDDASVIFNTNGSYISDIRGSAEIHITDLAEFVWNWENRTVNATIINQSIDEIWNYTNRSLTYYPDMTNYSKIAEDVWLYTTRNLTYFPTQLDLTNYTLISDVVWSYLNRTLTDYNQSDLTNYTKIIYDTWTYMNRSLTEFNFDVVNESLVSDFTWNNTNNRSLTEFNFDVVNETEIADSVWSWAGSVSNNILGQFGAYIWNWTGTIGNNIGDFFSNKIWTRTDRNLTYYEDVTNYSKIGEFVWNNTVGGRNLTYFPAQQDLTNYTLIQDLITQFGNNDVTNYTLMQQLITLYGNTDLTNYTLMQYLISQYGNNQNQTDLTNYTEIQNLITQYGNTDTVNYTLVEDLITQFGNEDVTNYTYIGNLVVQYGNNDNTNYTLMQDLILQYGNNQNQTDMTNYTLMAELMTQFANNDVTNYTAIQDLITQYGNNDVSNYTLIQYLVSQYGNNDNTNYTLMQDLITQYGNTDAVNYTLVQALISQYGNVDVTDYNKIGEFVWNWTTRELTGFNLTVNASINTTDLTNQIWSWSNRSLTFYADMTNYTKINVGVWNYNNRTLFFLYGNGTGSINQPSGKLPLSNIIISTPDPFYFDIPYEIYYDPVDIKGATVDIQNISVKILENITYQADIPYLLTDGRYKQTITIPQQEITSFTLDVNMTQGVIKYNQKSFVTLEKKKAGITGFVVSMDSKTKKNLFYLGLFFLFILFIYVLIAVASKNKKEKNKGGYDRY